MKLDPVTLEIMCQKFGAVADEMTSNLKRASRSVYVKEAGDFGTALVDRDGHVFAYPDSTSVSAIERPCGEIRWVDHRAMLSDGLTKIGGNLSLLVDFMRRGAYGLTATSTLISERQRLKDLGVSLTVGCMATSPPSI